MLERLSEANRVVRAEFRRLGVVYGGNCGRDRIDAATDLPPAYLPTPLPTPDNDRA